MNLNGYHLQLGSFVGIVWNGKSKNILYKDERKTASEILSFFDPRV